MPFVLAMFSAPVVLAATPLPFLGEMVALFLLAALIAYLCDRIRLVPIAGFLLTGVLIGPHALALVEDQELVDMLAEVGVILLLFTIGLEFSLQKLSRLGRAIFVGGGLQVGLTVGAVTALLAAFGVSWQAGVYTGCLVALGSTAIVLGLLAERAETDTPTGQLSLAMLIFQDLAIIVMVLIVPLLSGTGGAPVAVLGRLGLALAVVAGVLVLARYLVPPMLRRVAETRRPEIFILAVVAVCFGTAWLTNLAGISLALGAFLAGLVVSESQYSDQALSEILPFRTVFSAVFFISVGMLLDMGFVLSRPLLIVGAAAFILLLKALITGGSVLALGYPSRIAVAVALSLAQVGEFSFVLERVGRAAGLSPAGLGAAGGQVFIAVAVLLMLATPFLVQAGPQVGAWFQRGVLDRDARRREERPAGAGEEGALEDHVVIVGYGPAGRRLGQVFDASQIPHFLIEMNPQSAREARAEGKRVLYGDASRPHILEEAGLLRAKLCVVVINDRAAARRITRLARFQNPTLQIIVRTRFIADLEALYEAGADVVVPEELETAVRILSHVLGAYMVPPAEIERYMRSVRSSDYEVLRGSIQEAHLMVLKGLDEEGLHTRAVAVREGAAIAGETLEEAQLRRRYDLTVLAVRRGERTLGNPAGGFRIEAGDRLVLVGSSERFARCAGLFREKQLTLEDVALEGVEH